MLGSCCRSLCLTSILCMTAANCPAADAPAASANPAWHMDDASAVNALLADGGSGGMPGVAARIEN